MMNKKVVGSMAKILTLATNSTLLHFHPNFHSIQHGPFLSIHIPIFFKISSLFALDLNLRKTIQPYPIMIIR
nr:hypothetical protein CFP56_59576 [Quercus suber]